MEGVGLRGLRHIFGTVSFFEHDFAAMDLTMGYLLRTSACFAVGCQLYEQGAYIRHQSEKYSIHELLVQFQYNTNAGAIAFRLFLPSLIHQIGQRLGYEP